MSSQKFFQAIDNSFVGRFVDKKHNQILNTDTSRIYVENVRSFFGISTRFAKFLCQIAVNQKLFKKHIGVVCSNKECERIIISVDDRKKLPSQVSCSNCLLNEIEPNIFPFESLETIEFYELIV